MFDSPFQKLLLIWSPITQIFDSLTDWMENRMENWSVGRLNRILKNRMDG